MKNPKTLVQILMINFYLIKFICIWQEKKKKKRRNKFEMEFKELFIFIIVYFHTKRESTRKFENY